LASNFSPGYCLERAEECAFIAAETVGQELAHEWLMMARDWRTEAEMEGNENDQDEITSRHGPPSGKAGSASARLSAQRDLHDPARTAPASGPFSPWLSLARRAHGRSCASGLPRHNKGLR
jgi:hypothetical protein